MAIQVSADMEQEGRENRTRATAMLQAPLLGGCIIMFSSPRVSGEKFCPISSLTRISACQEEAASSHKLTGHHVSWSLHFFPLRRSCLLTDSHTRFAH